MFRVIFSLSGQNGITVRNCNSVEEAVSFALDLHRSSNVAHSVSVYGCDSTHCILGLDRFEDEN